MVGKTTVGVGVGAFIIDEHGNVLLMKRSSKIPSHRTTVGMWSVPGGKVEFKETAIDAVKREVLEELGIKVSIKKYIGYSDQILSNAHWISLHFLCTIKSGKPRIMEPAKCTQIAWYPVNELPKNAGITHVLRPALLMGYLSKSDYEKRKTNTTES